MGSVVWRYIRQYIIGIVIGSLASSTPAQQIFKAKWKGIAVQSFATDNKPIVKFITHSTGDYVYLKAHTEDNSQDIVKACWKGIAFQDFAFSGGEWLKGFEISGPDAEGWVYLKAVGNSGSNKEILKTKLKGSFVQGYTAPANQWIKGFKADKDGEWAILSAQTGNVVGIEEDEENLEEFFFSFSAAVPNPSPGYPNVSYSIAKPVRVSLDIYDCSGKVIKTVVEDFQRPGKYQLIWDRRDNLGREVSSGIYFFKFRAGDFRTTKKVVLIK
jgi:hypothetical protein